MNLELNDVQAEVLTRELHYIIQNDRYPLSPRIVALKEILGQLQPEPQREPLPELRAAEQGAIRETLVSSLNGLQNRSNINGVSL